MKRLTFYHFSAECSESRRLLPLMCLPVDDILDVVMHALVVSSSVGLEVKSHLGGKKRWAQTQSVAGFHSSSTVAKHYTAVSTQQ